MIDLNTTAPSAAHNGETSKLKNLMERTPGIGVLKSKFLTVLGNSNELLNGISNKLTLNISSSDSEFCDDEEQSVHEYDESIDYTKIDFESRRVKARRAHEEIISGRYRHPNLAPRTCLEARMDKTKPGTSSSSSSTSTSSTSSSCSLSMHAPERSQVSSTTCSNSIESRHSGGYGRPGRVIAGARRSDMDMQKDLTTNRDIVTSLHQHDMHLLSTTNVAATADGMWLPTRSRASNSSTLTSLHDEPGAQISPSVESTDWRNFIRSESQNSVPSWASSISLDCRVDEEPHKEFMKRFTYVLFSKPDAVDLEMKSQFGDMARLETGRQWFTRFLVEQKTKSKRMDEVTFHMLVQYCSIVLFECGECEDYVPAAVIMHLCFLFYYEIDVPGCEPYREYIYMYMRQQPIWQQLRFWNAAFFEAVQNEREKRVAAKLRRNEARQKRQEIKQQLKQQQQQQQLQQQEEVHINANELMRKLPGNETEHSSSSSSMINSAMLHTKRVAGSIHDIITDRKASHEMQIRETAVFRQLGVFTSNMHALGIPQNMCLDFLKKQTTSFNLSKEKIKSIKDNIQRMYHETEMWGAKEC